MSAAEPAAATVVADQSVPTRPCLYCGRPVPQRSSSGRPFQYCRDNDDACLKAARNARSRERHAPGLPGQLAQTWELVDRLEQSAALLATSINGELSAAGVESKIAAVRAEAAAQSASAAAEARDAQAAAESARAETQTAIAQAEREGARREEAQDRKSVV